MKNSIIREQENARDEAGSLIDVLVRKGWNGTREGQMAKAGSLWFGTDTNEESPQSGKLDAVVVLAWGIH